MSKYCYILSIFYPFINQILSKLLTMCCSNIVYILLGYLRKIVKILCKHCQNNCHIFFQILSIYYPNIAQKNVYILYNYFICNMLKYYPNISQIFPNYCPNINQIIFKFSPNIVWMLSKTMYRHCLNIIWLLPKNCLHIINTYYATKNATFDANDAIKNKIIYGQIL